MIKVILKEDVKGHGKKNDILDVSDGFARNFLLPRGKAVPATPDKVHFLEQDKSQLKLQEDKIIETHAKEKERIESLEIKITGKASSGKLFGSISAKEIAAALEKEGVSVEPKSIIIKNPIKTVGKHKIGIVLDKNNQAELEVEVAGE